MAIAPGNKGQANDFINTSAGAADAGKGVKLDANGLINDNMLPSNITRNPMTTQYDLVIGGANGAPGRLAKGANGTVLMTTGGVTAWGNHANIQEFTDNGTWIKPSWCVGEEMVLIEVVGAGGGGGGGGTSSNNIGGGGGARGCRWCFCCGKVKG